MTTNPQNDALYHQVFDATKWHCLLRWKRLQIVNIVGDPEQQMHHQSPASRNTIVAMEHVCSGTVIPDRFHKMCIVREPGLFLIDFTQLLNKMGEHGIASKRIIFTTAVCRCAHWQVGRESCRLIC